jgi:hypothetical protein
MNTIQQRQIFVNYTFSDYQNKTLETEFIYDTKQLTATNETNDFGWDKTAASAVWKDGMKWHV